MKKLFILCLALCLVLCACASTPAETKPSEVTKPTTSTPEPKPTEPQPTQPVLPADVYAVTKGLWLKDGRADLTCLEMDGKGGFVMKDADGIVMARGSLEAVDEYGDGTYSYNMRLESGDFIGAFSFDTETQIHMGNADGDIFLLAPAVNEVMKPTEGIWYEGGDRYDDYIVMDGLGGFCYYDNIDELEAEGYLEAVDEFGDGSYTYNMYTLNGTWLDAFWFDSEMQIHFGNGADAEVFVRLPEMDDEVYQATLGRWFVNADFENKCIVMDGMGGFIMYHAGGMEAADGYLIAVDEYGDGSYVYQMYDDGVLLATFAFDSESQFHIGNGVDADVYYKVDWVPQEPADMADYLGYWIYADGEVLQILSEDEWYQYDEQGRLEERGYGVCSDQGLYLYDLDGELEITLVFVDGVLYDFEDTESLRYSEDFPYGAGDNV